MRILLISLAFAPYSGVGAARMTSLAAYLSKHKHYVHVIAYDKSFYKENECKRPIPNNVTISYIACTEDKKENIINLQKAICKVIFDNSIDLCIYSVGPYDLINRMPRIKNITGVPYVIDYRDIWLFDCFPEGCGIVYKVKSIVYSLLMCLTERRAFKNASEIVFVTQGCLEKMMKRYHLKSDKLKLIYNGYENKYTYTEEKKTDDFVLAVAGKFKYYNPRAAVAVLDACEKSCVKLVHVGIPDEEFQNNYRCSVYDYRGVKNYKETLDILAEADAFVITYQHKIGLGTKVFDYLAMNKPIIYVGPQNTELAGFVSSWENGYVCENEENIIQVLQKLKQGNHIKFSNDDIDFFSREQQNILYEEILLEIVEEKK